MYIYEWDLLNYDVYEGRLLELFFAVLYTPVVRSDVWADNTEHEFFWHTCMSNSYRGLLAYIYS